MKNKRFRMLPLLMLLISACGNTNSSQNNNHLEHAFVNETIIKEATCTIAGSKKIECECGAYITESIPATGHSYNWETKVEATCTTKEELLGTCKECGNTITKIGEALGHKYEWETKVEATCLEPEVLEGTCKECGDVVTKEGREALGHDYGEYYSVIDATSTKEGLVKASCANGCALDKTLTVLKTPVISRENDVITWPSVDNATGYRIFNEGELYKDLGNVTSYNIPIEEDNYLFEVEAYTDEEGYYEVSKKSNILSVFVSKSNNLQQGLGTDFEAFKKSTEPYDLGTTWKDSWGNYSNGKITILKDDNTTCAKLLPSSNNSFATITNSANVKILKAGTYTVSLDVKLGSAVDGQLTLVGLYTGSWVTGTRNISFDLTKANSSSWSTLTLEYTLDSDVSGGYVNVDIGYKGVTSGTNNYVLIDNFNVFLKGTTTNLNTGSNIDFENSLASSTSLSSSGWKKETIYVNSDSLENSVETIDGNAVFKMYASKFKASVVDFKGNTSIASAGIYKLTLKAKAGPEANRLGSIGFRMFWGNTEADGLLVTDVRFTQVDTINTQEWVTLEASFKVPANKVATYVNIEIFAFTNNDVNSSVDNYLLIDDLSVYKFDIQ